MYIVYIVELLHHENKGLNVNNICSVQEKKAKMDINEASVAAIPFRGVIRDSSQICTHVIYFFICSMFSL